jgi:hypothetical protein
VVSLELASRSGTGRRVTLVLRRRNDWPSYLVRFGAVPPVHLDLTNQSRQACISLSNHLIANPSLLASCASPIVELGAGVGLLSLVAARLNSKTHIVATDADESVLEQLVGNVTLSELSIQSVRRRKGADGFARRRVGYAGASKKARLGTRVLSTGYQTRVGAMGSRSVRRSTRADHFGC